VACNATRANSQSGVGDGTEQEILTDPMSTRFGNLCPRNHILKNRFRLNIIGIYLDYRFRWRVICELSFGEGE
jgi:hypothetical protein